MINPTYFVCANSSSSLILASILLCGCSILTPSNISPPRLYSFDSSTTTTTLPHLATANAINRQVTIVVGIPRAAPGFESRQMAYIRQTHQLEYFKQSEWVAAPATMLSPLVASAAGQRPAARDAQAPARGCAGWKHRAPAALRHRRASCEL